MTRDRFHEDGLGHAGREPFVEALVELGERQR